MELLQLDQQELTEILNTNPAYGPLQKEKGGTSQGFTLAVKTYAEIRKAYMHMKLFYPDAEHIICAYSIPGMEDYYTQDSCDDGEHYAGQKLLDMMRRNDITSRVIFVVRYTDGTKLGPVRFDRILQAAQEAIKKAPFNKYAGVDQEVKSLFPPKRDRKAKESTRAKQREDEKETTQEHDQSVHQQID